MKLYHGSYCRVKKPSLSHCRPNTDFGKGFYTTTSLEQAEKWARIIKERQGLEKSFISVYEVDDNILKKEYKAYHFPEPSKEWLDFVVENRNARKEIDYDIVKGPVADDTVYRVITLYEEGDYPAEIAINRLKPEKLFDQFSFHTEEVLKELSFVRAIEID